MYRILTPVLKQEGPAIKLSMEIIGARVSSNLASGGPACMVVDVQMTDYYLEDRRVSLYPSEINIS